MSKAVSYSLFFLSFIPLWITVIFIDGKSLIEGNENNCTEKISIALILLNIIICFIVLLVKINHKEHTYLYIIEKAAEHIFFCFDMFCRLILRKCHKDSPQQTVRSHNRSRGQPAIREDPPV